LKGAVFLGIQWGCSSPAGPIHFDARRRARKCRFSRYFLHVGRVWRCARHRAHSRTQMPSQELSFRQYFHQWPIGPARARPTRHPAHQLGCSRRPRSGPPAKPGRRVEAVSAASARDPWQDNTGGGKSRLILDLDELCILNLRTACGRERFSCSRKPFRLSFC
jgi:hypothetical protein